MEVVECVPNFSTSDKAVVETILEKIREVNGVHILDHTYDSYYNRLVVTFVGRKEPVLRAALNAAVKAVELIDMNKHKGQHPRIGAVDVIPFIPIEGVTMDECVRLAKELGKEFAERCNVPVYLYGEAATRPERKDLDWIRKGEYEGLRQMMKEPGREPDFGPPEPHLTAGATAVGARKLLVGFNVNLGTSDLSIAKRIAKALHVKKGGLSNVKAMAASIPERGITQIGMSILDFERTPLYRVFELVRIEAKRYNVPIVGSEFCGMIPLKALIDVVGYYLKVDNIVEGRVLELAVREAMEGRRQ